jgi:O-antigen/teichoic acid export membrane protein
VAGQPPRDPVGAELTSKVTRNALYNLFGQSSLLLLGFLAARFLFRGLGEDAFGLILFATTLNAVMANVLDLGLTATTVRVVAVHRRDVGYVVAYVRTATLLYWSVYVLLVCAAYLTVPAIVTHWIHLSTLSPASAAPALFILLTGAFSSLPRNLYSSLFRGLQRMEFNNVIEVGLNAVQQVGTVAILVFGGGLMTVALWMLLVYAVAALTYLALLTRFLPVGALLPGFSRQAVADQWKYAASVGGSSVLSAAFVQSDKVVVSKLLPLSAFGYYTFAWTAVWRVAALATVVSQAAFPSLAALIQSGDRPRVVEQFRRLQDVVCYATAVPIAALGFMALPAFGYLFGTRVAESLLTPVLLLCLAYYMHATLIMLMAVAGAAGRPDLLTRLNLIAVFTFLPALVLLVIFFGLTGAGLAWLSYYVLAYCYLVPRVCRGCLGISALGWYRRVARVLSFVAGTYGLAWIVCFAFYRYDPAAWVLFFVVSTIPFAALTWFAVGRRRLGGSFGRFLRPILAK